MIGPEIIPIWEALGPREKADYIRPLIEQGRMSYADIGRRLGVSRVAIAGVADRNKIKSPYARGVRGAAGGAAHKAKRSAQRAMAAAPGTKQTRIPPKPERAPPRLPKVPHDPAAWAALPDTHPVPLHELAHDQCKWPIGEDAPHLFCAAPRYGDTPYCATHLQRSQPKEPSATVPRKKRVWQ